jgi:2-methylcitrate dehydratase PrpD
MLAGEKWDASILTKDLGAAWRGGEARFKYYPCAHVIQPYLDVVLKLRNAHGLKISDIAEVCCAIAPWAIPIVCEPRESRLAPKTELEAIASLPYMVAHALADGRVTLAALDEAARTRADLHALAAQVVHEPNAAMGQGFDARVAIRTTSGAIHSADADAAILDTERLSAKFVDTATPIMGAERARAAAAALLAMAAPDTRAIADITRAA